MGMSTNVVGIREYDDAHKAKVRALDACLAAGVTLPPELAAYFVDEYGDETEDSEAPLRVGIEDLECVEEYSDGDESGLQVDLHGLPEGVRWLRFTSSW